MLGLGSVSILREKSFSDLKSYYNFMAMALVLVAPISSSLAILAVLLGISPVGWTDSWSHSLDIYAYPNNKYWLNLQTSILYPVFVIYFYYRSFDVEKMTVPVKGVWFLFLVCLYTLFFSVAHVYFGWAGETGRVSSFASKSFLGIHMMNHVILMAGAFSGAVVAILITRMLGGYNGKSGK